MSGSKRRTAGHGPACGRTPFNRIVDGDTDQPLVRRHRQRYRPVTRGDTRDPVLGGMMRWPKLPASWPSYRADGEVAQVHQCASMRRSRARRAGRRRCPSPLVKTAFFASDPNLGRILAAVGNAGIADLDPERVQLYLDDVWVVRDGGRHPQYQEADGQRVMKQPEIRVHLKLGRGGASTLVWTTDLSHDYVSINADYRS
jgi:hypothetical protein